MDMEARPLCQPLADERGLVRSVVVQDEMDVRVRRDCRVHGVEELPEFDRAMPAMELGDHRAGFDIGRGKQGRRAMAPIIMRPPSSLAGPHRQRRLGTVQGLNLRFLVNTEDGGVRRRIHIQADAVTLLVDQPRAGRELECLTAVGLQAEGVPNLLDGRPAHAARLRHVSAAPMGCPGGASLPASARSLAQSGRR